MKKIFWLLILLVFLLLIPQKALAVDPRHGLAAGYPFDNGIKNNPAVIMAENFDNNPNWTDGTYSWIYDAFPLYSSYVTYRAIFRRGSGANSGQGTLEQVNKECTHMPGGYDIPFSADFPEGGYDKVYIRWYHKFDEGYDFGGYQQLSSEGGCGERRENTGCKGNGVYAKTNLGDFSGIIPNGYDRFSAKLQFFNMGNSTFEPNIYTYNPNQKCYCPDGKVYQGDACRADDKYKACVSWGDNLPQNVGTPLLLEAGRWYSFELMIKANDAGQNNGELELWIDGVLKSHYSNLLFRKTNDLKINLFTLTSYFGGDWVAAKDQKSWDDNIVLATEYIGPMVEEALPTSTGEDVTGDVNGDGVVDMVDVKIVLKNYGASPPTDARMDLNNDNKINMIDVAMVVKNCVL